MSEDNKKTILDALGVNDPIKQKAQKGQRLLTEAILELLKKQSPPDREGWTAGPITEKLGLYEGYTTGDGGNHWLAQSFLRELHQKGLIRHLGDKQGYIA